MINNANPAVKNQPFPLSKEQQKAHLKVNEINYQNNIDSDYTEKIKQLDKSFDYASNSQHYWSKPEFSILYGTPIYEVASPSQKLGLNHLYWVAQYDQIAAGESSTMLYNQVTAGVFSSLGGYETLCQEIELETSQEWHHAHAFQKIGYKTKTALLGKPTLSNSQAKGLKLNNSYSKQLAPLMQKLFNFNWDSSLSASRYNALRFITKMMLNNQYYYSKYLKELEKKGEYFPIPRQGYFGIATPKPMLQFFTFNWGSSPFLACQHYTYRFTGNMVLKNYEYRYHKYYKELEKKGEFIPAPTAVSYYHLLDESFHTTTSQLIGRDLYKDFPQPTGYEKFLANAIAHMMQLNFLNGLCSGIPAVFLGDGFYMPFYYKLLRSPLFNMSSKDALYWMEKCFCHEHEGFHVGVKYHKRLLQELLRFSSSLEYLNPNNRELRLMASRGSISNALQNNIKAFKQFSKNMDEV